jgi:hypothetical protein
MLLEYLAWTQWDNRYYRREGVVGCRNFKIQIKETARFGEKTIDPFEKAVKQRLKPVSNDYTHLIAPSCTCIQLCSTISPIA